MLLPEEMMPYFENAIYFPLLLKVLELDRKEIERGNYKFKRPYLTMIEGAIDLILKEQRETAIYMRENKLKLIRGISDNVATEYTFVYGGYEDTRRYLNVRLRNRTEELLGVYLDMAR